MACDTLAFCPLPYKIFETFVLYESYRSIGAGTSDWRIGTMKIPAVREELEDLALQLKAQEGRNWKTVARKMEGLVPELKRRSPKRRAKVKNAEGRKRNPLSREQKQEIALFAKTHPDWMLQEIGTKFGVNQGRVSEIIAGFRK
jgi:hypothetical protein